MDPSDDDVPYSIGEQIVDHGEAYTIVHIAPLNPDLFDDTLSERWGTHVILLRRVRDGSKCISNVFSDGSISKPEDWISKFML